MSGGSVATMSRLGFIKGDFQLAMDRHITYFFAARRDQLKIIPNVPSFEWTLMQNQGDEKRLLREMQSALKSYFLEIADSVEVITSSTFEKEGDGTFTMSIAVSCMKDDVQYDLQKAVLVSGQSFKILKAARGT